MRIYEIALLLIMLVIYRSVYGETDIVYWRRLEDNPVVVKVLQLALDKTVASHGPYRLRASEPMEQERAVVELAKGQSLDLANFAPSRSREQRLLPVRVPVTQGLLGHRVCLIKKGRQARFDQVISLQDWQDKRLTIGQEKNWPDTAVLEANRIQVVKAPKYPAMFAMLDLERFDCFARSISEVGAELRGRKDIELEKNLLLIYRLPTFFFVNRQRADLAARLEQGLNLAYRDGSIPALISDRYRDAFRAMDIAKRTVIYLENPLLSEETQQALNGFRYWLDVKHF